jgi:hypothetical protein
MGLSVAAKGHRGRRLPVGRQEYLGIDLTAYPTEEADSARWPWPVAAFELENSVSDDLVAYSLWKVLCVRAELRVVFAYRPDWERGRGLVAKACEGVIGTLCPAQRAAIDGEVAMAIGSRGEGETFPWGYFKFWLLNQSLGRFEKV